MPQNGLDQCSRKKTSQNAAKHLQLSEDLNIQQKCYSCLCCFRPVPKQRASVQRTFPVYRENHARSDPIDPISIHSGTKIIRYHHFANVKHDPQNAKKKNLLG